MDRIDTGKLPSVHDGQHKVGGKKHNCFFCMKDKLNCQAFSMTGDVQPGMETIYGSKFVVCPECWAKGSEFLAKHLFDWAATQKLLKKRT